MINRIIKITRLVRFSLKRENLFHPFFWIFPTSFSRVSFLNNRARERERKREDGKIGRAFQKGAVIGSGRGRRGKGKKKGWLVGKYCSCGI